MKKSLKHSLFLVFVLLAALALLAVIASAQNTDAADADALTAALAAAEDGDTITVTGDISTDTSFAVTKDVTITAASAHSIAYSGSSALFAVTDAELTLAGNLTYTVSGNYSLVSLAGTSADLTVTGGTIAQAYKLVLVTATSANVSISGLTTTAPISYWMVDATSTAIENFDISLGEGNDLTVKQMMVRAYAKNISLTVTAGTYKCTNNNMFYLASSANIQNVTATISGGDIVSDGSADVLLAVGGSVSNTINISGGKMDLKKDNFLIRSQAAGNVELNISGDAELTGNRCVFSSMSSNTAQVDITISGTAKLTSRNASYPAIQVLNNYAAKATLEITGSPEITSNDVGVLFGVPSEVTITGGTISAANSGVKFTQPTTAAFGGTASITSTNPAIHVDYSSAEGSTIEIESGTYRATAHNVMHITSAPSTAHTLNISGGTFTTDKYWCIAARYSTKLDLTITGGSFVNNAEAADREALLFDGNATVTAVISNATFKTTSSAGISVKTPNASLTVNSGTFQMPTGFAGVSLGSEAIAGTVNMNGGTFENGFILSRAADTLTPTFTIEKFTVDERNYYVDEEALTGAAVACIGEYGVAGTLYYPTLAAAIEAAQASDVIYLFKDTTEAVINFAKDVTIVGVNAPTASLSLHPTDGVLTISGFTITYAGAQRAVQASGDKSVEIVATDMIFISTDNTPLELAATGGNTLTAENCSFTGNGYYGVFLKNTAVNAVNTITLTNCTVSAKYAALYIGAPAFVEVTNCTISALLDPETKNAQGFYFASTATGANLTVSGETSVQAPLPFFAEGAQVDLTVESGSVASSKGNAPFTVTAASTSISIAANVELTLAENGALVSVPTGADISFSADDYPEALATNDGTLWFANQAALDHYMTYGTPVAIGETPYLSLDDALADAVNGTVITIRADLTVPTTIVIDKEVTFAAEGKVKLSFTGSDADTTHLFEITTGGALTLTGNLGIEVTKARVALFTGTAPALTITVADAAVIEAKTASNNYVGAMFYNESADGAVLTLNSGIVRRTVTGTVIATKAGAGKMTFTQNGGSVSNGTGTTSAGDRTISVYSEFEWNMTAGSIESLGQRVYQAWTGSTSKIRISGGTLHNTVTDIMLQFATAYDVEITGGTFNQDAAGTNGAFYLAATGTFTIAGTAQLYLNSTYGFALRAAETELNIGGDAHITMTNTDTNNTCYGIHCNGAPVDAVITITGGTLEVKKGDGMYFNVPSDQTKPQTVNMSGGKIIAQRNGIYVGGTIIFNGSGTAEIETTENPAIYVAPSGTSTTNGSVLNISGGTYNSKNHRTILLTNTPKTTSTLNITGGTIKTGKYTPIGVQSNHSANIVISGGTFDSTKATYDKDCVYIAQDAVADITILGGTFKGSQMARLASSQPCTLRVYGGDQTGVTWAPIWIITDNHTIEIGAPENYEAPAGHTLSELKLFSGNGLYRVNNAARVVNFTCNLTGEVKSSELNEGVYYYIQDAATTPVCRIAGGAEYTDLQDAVNAAEAGDVIELLADIALPVSVNVTKNLTLRGAADVTPAPQISTVSAVTIYVKNGATLTLGANLTVESATYRAVEVSEANGALIVDGATVRSGNNSPVEISAANVTVTVRSGKILTSEDQGYYGIFMNGENATVNIEGGEVFAYNDALYINQPNGTVNISGGLIHNNNASTDAVITAADLKTGTLRFTMTGGTIESARYAIYQRSDMVMRFEGGTIKAVKYAINQYNNGGKQIPNKTELYVTGLTVEAGCLLNSISVDTVAEINGLRFTFGEANGTSRLVNVAAGTVQSYTITLGADNQVTNANGVINAAGTSENSKITVLGGTYVCDKAATLEGNTPVIVSMFNLAGPATLNIFSGTFRGQNETNIVSSSKGGVANLYAGVFRSDLATVIAAADKDEIGGTVNVYGGRYTLAAETGTVFSKDEQSTLNLAGGFTAEGGETYLAGMAYAENTNVYTKSVVTMNAGAQVRLAETSGLRFISHVDADTVAYLSEIADADSLKFYTIILPTQYLAGLSAPTAEAVMAALTENKGYVKIEAHDGLIEDGEGGYYIRAALVNIKPLNYGRSFSAIAFAAYTVDGVAFTQSTLYNAADNARSIRMVAQAALADTSRTYSAEELAVLNAYAGNQVAMLLPAAIAPNGKKRAA